LEFTIKGMHSVSNILSKKKQIIDYHVKHVFELITISFAEPCLRAKLIELQ